MHRYAFALALLTVRCAASGSGSRAHEIATPSSPAVSTSVTWGDCTFSGTETAQPSRFRCATLRVPFCHETAPCASTHVHELDLFRRQTSTDDDAPTVWVVSESASASQTADLMERITAQVGGATTNVYELHMRLWNPPFADNLLQRPCQSLAHDFGDRVFIDNATLAAVDECRNWIDSQIGPDGSNAYSLTNAASDLDLGLQLAQSQELKSNSNVYVMSTGKASRVVHRLLALQSKSTSAIAGFIFDTPHAMKLQAHQDSITGEASSRYLSGCASDATCRSKFASLSMSMSEVVETMLATLDKSPDAASKCLNTLKAATYVDSRDLRLSHGLRRFLAGQRHQPSNMKLTAPLLYRMQRCGSKDGQTLTALLNFMKSTAQAEPASMGLFVERLVAFSELWPSSVPSQQQLAAAFEENPVGVGAMSSQLSSASDSISCKGIYKCSPTINSSRVLTYPAPNLSNSSVIDSANGLSVPKSTDMLIFASRLNMDGSSVVAKQLYDLISSKQASDRTSVLVESDNLLSTETESDMQETLFKLVGRFVTKSAQGFAGVWHVSDLDGLDWTKASTSPTLRSTYSTAPVSLNFTRTDDEERSAPLKFGPDLYEYVIPPKRGGALRDDDDYDSGVDPLVYVIAVGVPLLFFVRLWYAYRKRCCCRRRQDLESDQTSDATTTAPWPSQPAYYHQQQYQQPTQWGQQHQPAVPRTQQQPTHWGLQPGESSQPAYSNRNLW